MSVLYDKFHEVTSYFSHYSNVNKEFLYPHPHVYGEGNVMWVNNFFVIYVAHALEQHDRFLIF